MKKNNLFLLGIVLFALVVSGIAAYLYRQGQQPAGRRVLNIYIPCGMTLPFKELAMAYESAQRGTKVEALFDNSNVLTKFVVNKDKRPELFVSPGKQEIGILIRKGLIEEDSIRPFGKYELILVAPAKSRKIKGLPDLLSEPVKNIAIANPDFNSIGVSAIESLRSLGYWDKIQAEKFILFTNTPIEALSFVAAEKADAAVHYNICPFQTSSDKVAQGALKVVAQLPSGSQEPIRSYIGILKDSDNKEEAKRFIDFMFSKKGSRILSRYGLGEAAGQQVSLSPEEKPKVVIEAYYPFNEEHLFIRDYLESLEKKYGGKVKVECVDFRSDSGYLRWRKAGLACGGILINGKNKFNVTKDGETKEIEFLKRMDTFWTKEDLEGAVQQELEK